MSVNNFKAAVVNSDITAIQRLAGSAKRQQRGSFLELKDKLGVGCAWEAASSAHAPHPKKNKANEAVLASRAWLQTDRSA